MAIPKIKLGQWGSKQASTTFPVPAPYARPALETGQPMIEKGANSIFVPVPAL